jgi:hypothetical protein
MGEKRMKSLMSVVGIGAVRVSNWGWMCQIGWSVKEGCGGGAWWKGGQRQRVVSWPIEHRRSSGAAVKPGGGGGGHHWSREWPASNGRG